MGLRKKIADQKARNVAKAKERVKQGGQSVPAALEVLAKTGALDIWQREKFGDLTVSELHIWRKAVQSKSSYAKRLLPTIEELIKEKDPNSRRKIAGLKPNSANASSFSEWAKQEAEDTGKPSRRLSPSLNKLDPNPFQRENEKVYKRGRGTVRERCNECGEINAIDLTLLTQVLHRRANTARGRIDAWADRQLEGGARMTGNHTAAEMSRANQMHIANLVTTGFPCAHCGAPLVR